MGDRAHSCPDNPGKPKERVNKDEDANDQQVKMVPRPFLEWRGGEEGERGGEGKRRGGKEGREGKRRGSPHILLMYIFFSSTGQGAVVLWQPTAHLQLMILPINNESRDLLVHEKQDSC